MLESFWSFLQPLEAGNVNFALRFAWMYRGNEMVWVKSQYPKWNPGKWKHGPKPAVPSWFNFDPYPYVYVSNWGAIIVGFLLFPQQITTHTHSNGNGLICGCSLGNPTGLSTGSETWSRACRVKWQQLCWRFPVGRALGGASLSSA